MKKVAHFTRVFLNNTETFIINQIDNHLHFRPVIICKKKINNNEYASYLSKKFSLLNLGEIFNNNFLYKIFRRISRKEEKKIIEYLKNEQISILHFHYGTDAGMYSNIVKKINIPSVVSFYGYDCSGFPKRYFGYGKTYLQKKVFNVFPKFLAMSEDMKTDLIKIGCPHNKIIVHYHGINLEKFKNIKRHYKEKKILTLLIIASITPQKGHLFLVKAIKTLLNKNIFNFHLNIVGDGFLKKQIQQWIKKNKIDKYINFLGALPHKSKEMLEEIQKADIFVHPSITAPNGDKEGIPGAIVEAMASGLPVISTFHAGIPHIIENKKNGLLVNENNINELASAIDTLIKNAELRKILGENARNFVINNLDLKAKEKNLENIYSQLIEK